MPARAEVVLPGSKLVDVFNETYSIQDLELLKTSFTKKFTYSFIALTHQIGEDKYKCRVNWILNSNVVCDGTTPTTVRVSRVQTVVKPYDRCIER